MAGKIVAVLMKDHEYWAWVNQETDLLRRRNDLCLNCRGVGGGEAGGCPAEQQLMRLCAENDLRVGVSRCPLWQPAAKSRTTAAKERHHGVEVLVNAALESVRRDQCLCLNCDKCRPGRRDHCFMAAAMYRICVAGNLALVITRCPEWEPKK